MISSIFFISKNHCIISSAMGSVITLLLAFIVSLGITLVLMPLYIKALKALKYSQTVSEYALEEYKEKGKTPIMGGLLFVVIPLVVVALIDIRTLFDPACLLIIVSYVAFCFIGFLDDILIIIRHDNEGLAPKFKMALQLIFALVIWLIFKDVMGSDLYLPLIDIRLPLGVFYGLFCVFMYTAEANAVNFTDGMDGLSSGVSLIAIVPYLIFALIEGRYDIALLIVSIMGALLGYLRYNFFPAKIFMGDSGSLALGALFTSIAIALDKELLLIIVGGVFFWEMLCVCIQQLAVRLFHKRVFKFTPIHYAFVLDGLKEKTVVKRFYVIQAICSLIGLLIGVLG